MWTGLISTFNWSLTWRELSTERCMRWDRNGSNSSRDEDDDYIIVLTTECNKTACLWRRHVGNLDPFVLLAASWERPFNFALVNNGRSCALFAAGVLYRPRIYVYFVVLHPPLRDISPTNRDNKKYGAWIWRICTISEHIYTHLIGNFKARGKYTHQLM